MQNSRSLVEGASGKAPYTQYPSCCTGVRTQLSRGVRALSSVVPAIHLALGVQDPTPVAPLEPRQQMGSNPISPIRQLQTQPIFLAKV